jgi:NADPH-dependent glutamate synthase beta subunit-like oxidoreductase/ferredoxin
VNMPRVVIDNQSVDVAAGSTLLDAARKLGLDVPALCWHEGCRPNTSCMVCLVNLKDTGRLVPSCATIAEEGMRIESETEEVRQVRRGAIELLLSDHAGECRAPCQLACPLGTDIPRMIRQVADGHLEDAIATVRQDVALAGVLGRLCPEFCERACRRGAVDEPASICLLKRYVADKDLASPRPYRPRRKPDSGKRVAIIGAGPAGLAAAYFLLREGHACTLFEAKDRPGGRLRAIPEPQLPRDVLEAEVTLLEKLGVRFELRTSIGRDRKLDELRRDYDAVLIAVGNLDTDASDWLGRSLALPRSPVAEGRLRVNERTHETELAGVFAAGDVVRRHAQPVHAVASGKAAAMCIDRYLRGAPVTGSRKLSTLGLGRPRVEEIAARAAAASSAGRIVPSDAAAGLTDEEARVEAQRCLHCDCHKLETCRLRKYAEMYGADARHYHGERRRIERLLQHPDIIFEPGKCILCGLCVQITEQAGEPLGLALVGRGFDTRVSVPFNESLAEALTVATTRCVEACPTGALAWRTESLCAARCPNRECVEGSSQGCGAAEPKQ